jgi:uncharacterized membrane protein (UPF0127 family)
VTAGGVAMRVSNLSQGTDLASAVEIAAGPVARALGLMGRRGWQGADGLLLQSCNSIHTFFMRMPIDVLFLDRDDRVLRAATVLPWRIGPIAWRARRALELPEGTIARSRTRPGDQLRVGH